MNVESANMIPFDSLWIEDLIKNVGLVTVGGTPSTSVEKYWGGEIPWMSSGDVHLKRINDVPGRISEIGLRSSNATLVNPPAVAIGLAGQGKTRGTVALVLMPLCTNQSVALIQGKEGRLDVHYLFYNLEFRYHELRSRSAGGGRAGLSKGILEQLPLALPRIDEQQSIATILSTIDRAIEQTESLIAKQQRIKTGLMQNLLTKGIDEHGNIRSEETHEFKDSPLGRIPVEWEVASIEDQFTIQTGFTLGEHRRPRKNTHPYLRVANVQRNNISVDDLAEIEVEKNELQGRLLESGDLLIVEGHANPEEIGRCAIVKDEAVGMTFQNHLFRLRPKNLSPYFCLTWLNSAWVRSYWKNVCGTSSGLNTINQKMLKKMLIPIFSANEQTKIGNLVNVQEQFIQVTLDHLRNIKRTKTGLMQDLLTGKVRVTDLLNHPPTP